MSCSSILRMLGQPRRSARRGGSSTHHGAANPNLQRQHRPRNQCGLRSIARERADALFIVGDPYFTIRRVQFANLAARHGIPASYVAREFPEAGGLMSYGTDIMDTYRQVGVYAGRILKGAKPADLPVVQASKFEFVINLQQR